LVFVVALSRFFSGLGLAGVELTAAIEAGLGSLVVGLDRILSMLPMSAAAIVPTSAMIATARLTTTSAFTLPRFDVFRFMALCSQVLRLSLGSPNNTPPGLSPCSRALQNLLFYCSILFCTGFV
jgi:hypothetical protein